MGGADSRRNFQPASARFSGFPPAVLMGLNVESTAPIPDLPGSARWGFLINYVCLSLAVLGTNVAVCQSISQRLINSGSGPHGGPPLKVAMEVSIRPLTWQSVVSGLVVSSEREDHSGRGLLE